MHDRGAPREHIKHGEKYRTNRRFVFKQLIVNRFVNAEQLRRQGEFVQYKLDVRDHLCQSVAAAFTGSACRSLPRQQPREHELQLMQKAPAKPQKDILSSVCAHATQNSAPIFQVIGTVENMPERAVSCRSVENVK